jgi:alkanesulfonate monooxygenase SsuD/methylene tetrahydromethanopterin reductase-like flavin-dependent oxidoreductase (luciferase family)
MKYGGFVNPSTTYEKTRQYALRIEELGFDSIHCPDHLIGMNSPPRQRPEDDFFEAWTIITALAVETQKIKIGHVVLCNGFRNPALLAKMISTLDHISNGRVLAWIGAGWYKKEFRQYSFPFPKGGVRVSQLEEAITIYKKMFTEDKASFEGRFYTLKRTLNNPKSIQKPYPQLVIGTMSGTRVVDIACREADGINLPFMVEIPDLPEKLSLINDNLKKYNRDPSEFEISVLYPVILVNTQESLDKIPERSQLNAFVGFPEDIKEKFAKLEDLGVKKVIAMRVMSPDFDHPLDVFKQKIM